ncbi:von Willebrand factor type A domain-containing protein [Candidatus Uabimicrobium sp. HlEnr_7]|uniref:YfbK domain-containing protein n=1 Tax=Candidatus Uabimicrobium helgolandensis TaxID=3095367 RepID=UPI0035561615
MKFYIFTLLIIIGCTSNRISQVPSKNQSLPQKQALNNTEKIEHSSKNISFSDIKKYLDNNELPPQDRINISKMVSDFYYDYLTPAGENLFSVHTEVIECPWNNKNWLVLIGIQGTRKNQGNIIAKNLHIDLAFASDVISHRLVNDGDNLSSFHEKEVKSNYTKTLLYEIEHSGDFTEYRNESALIIDGVFVPNASHREYNILNLSMSYNNGKKMNLAVKKHGKTNQDPSQRFKLSSAIAMMGMLLKQNSLQKINTKIIIDNLMTLPEEKYHFKKELLQMVDKMNSLL